MSFHIPYGATLTSDEGILIGAGIRSINFIGDGVTVSSDLGGNFECNIGGESVVRKNGSLIGSARYLNFITSGDVSLDSLNDQIDIELPTSTGGGSASGPSGAIQFNDGGAFGGSANLNWDSVNNTFTVKATSSQSNPLTQWLDSSGNSLLALTQFTDAWSKKSGKLNLWCDTSVLGVGNAELYSQGDEETGGSYGALYIVPPFHQSRIFFGRSDKKVFSLSMKHVMNIESMPAFGTTDGAYFGYIAAAAYNIGRSSGSLHITASEPSPTSGNIIFNTGNSGWGVYTEKMRINAAGTVQISGFSSTAKGLLIKMPVSPTENPFEIQNSSGLPITYFNAGGQLTLTGDASAAPSFILNATPGGGSAWLVQSLTTGVFRIRESGVADALAFSAGSQAVSVGNNNLFIGQLTVESKNSSTKGLVIRGVAGQSVPYFEIQNSSGVVLNKVTSAGITEISKTSFTANEGYIKCIDAAGTVVAELRNGIVDPSYGGELILRSTAASCGFRVNQTNPIFYSSGSVFTIYTNTTTARMIMAPSYFNFYGGGANGFGFYESFGGNLGNITSGAVFASAVYTSYIPLRGKGAAGQTANLLQLENSSGTVVNSVSPTGDVVLRNPSGPIVTLNWYGNDRSGALNLNGTDIQNTGARPRFSLMDSTLDGALADFGSFNSNGATQYFGLYKTSTPGQLHIKHGTSSWCDLTFANLTLKPSASRTPVNNGDLEIEATSNTSLAFKYKGSDGTVRSASLTLS